MSTFCFPQDATHLAQSWQQLARIQALTLPQAAGGICELDTGTQVSLPLSGQCTSLPGQPFCKAGLHCASQQIQYWAHGALHVMNVSTVAACYVPARRDSPCRPRSCPAGRAAHHLASGL